MPGPSGGQVQCCGSSDQPRSSSPELAPSYRTAHVVCSDEQREILVWWHSRFAEGVRVRGPHKPPRKLPRKGLHKCPCTHPRKGP
eukprot:8744426-Alexandrium_andersonii.AAC.1